MRQYQRNPEATDEAMTDDGYLRTGDLGSIDEDGFVSITGRKDIIITAGGKNLTPANLEVICAGRGGRPRRRRSPTARPTPSP